MTRFAFFLLSLTMLFQALPQMLYAQNNEKRFRDDDAPAVRPKPAPLPQHPVGEPPPPPAGEPPPPPAGQMPPHHGQPHHGQPHHGQPHHGQPHYGQPDRTYQRIRVRRPMFPQPLLTLRVGYVGLAEEESGVDFLSMFSASIEARFLHPFVFEAGFEANPFVLSGFGRAGVSFFLGRSRTRWGTGSDYTISVYGGYRYMQVAFAGLNQYHGLSLYVGFDWYLWLTPRFGLNFHLGGGAGVWVASNSNLLDIFYPEGRAAIGIAF